jgi:hypothetical protein
LFFYLFAIGWPEMLAFMQGGPPCPSLPAVPADPLSAATAASARETAALLATSLRCTDAGLQPSTPDGLPLGALTAAKRKLLSALVGGTPSGYCAELVAPL